MNILWTNSWGQVTRSILFTYTSDQHAAHIPRKGVANTVWKLTAGWQGGCKYPPIYLPIYRSTYLLPIYPYMAHLPTYYTYYNIYLSVYSILFYSTLFYSVPFYSILFYQTASPPKQACLTEGLSSYRIASNSGSVWPSALMMTAMVIVIIIIVILRWRWRLWF